MDIGDTRHPDSLVIETCRNARDVRDARRIVSIEDGTYSFTSYCFYCPAEHLDAIYGSARFPMGS